MSTDSKTVVVTGGGTGIGKAIAYSLAEDGHRVAIAGRRADVLRDAADAWKGPHAILAHEVDVADRDSVRKLFHWAASTLGSIDVLVNSAGVNIPNRTMQAMHDEQWDHVMNVNATGAYNCLRAVLPQMRQRRDGIIVNISSIAGIRVTQIGGVAYTASKFAVSALGLAVALETAGEGVRITNIYPGEVETPILDKRPTPVSREHRERILQPDDVAAMVLAVIRLPARAHVPELIIKPTSQPYG